MDQAAVEKHLQKKHHTTKKTIHPNVENRDKLNVVGDSDV